MTRGLCNEGGLQTKKAAAVADGITAKAVERETLLRHHGDSRCGRLPCTEHKPDAWRPVPTVQPDRSPQHGRRITGRRVRSTRSRRDAIRAPASRVKVPCLRGDSYNALSRCLSTQSRAGATAAHTQRARAAPLWSTCAQAPASGADAPKQYKCAALVRGPGRASLCLWAPFPAQLLRCLPAGCRTRGPRSCRRTCTGLDARPAKAEHQHCDAVAWPCQKLLPSLWHGAPVPGDDAQRQLSPAAAPLAAAAVAAAGAS